MLCVADSKANTETEKQHKQSESYKKDGTSSIDLIVIHKASMT